MQEFSGDAYGDRTVLEMTSSRKDHILKVHNELRNKIAMGEISGFGSAARMPALVSILIQTNGKKI